MIPNNARAALADMFVDAQLARFDFYASCLAESSLFDNPWRSWNVFQGTAKLPWWWQCINRSKVRIKCIEHFSSLHPTTTSPSSTLVFKARLMELPNRQRRRPIAPCSFHLCLLHLQCQCRICICSQHRFQLPCPNSASTRRLQFFAFRV